jgi:hypothetical protein
MERVSLAPQGSVEWLEARLGKVTASRFADVISKGVGKAASKTAETYKLELVAELLTKTPSSRPIAPAMQWGTDHEASAVAEYTWVTGNSVQETGFWSHGTIDGVGGSPDGLITHPVSGVLGIIEVKCPFNSVVHLQTIRNGMPKEHIAQIQGNMWVTDAQFADFISFDPRMPGSLKLYVERIDRDEEFIEELADKVSGFSWQVQLITEKLKEKASCQPTKTL